MSYADRIRQARSTPESMLVIAEGIDELLLRAEAAGPPSSSNEEWKSWGAGTTAVPSPDLSGAEATGGASTGRPAADAHPFDVIKIEVDPAELSRAREAQHQAEINFEAMRTRGPQPGQGAERWQQELEGSVMAMRATQAKVRQLEDPGAILNNAGYIPGESENTRTVAEGDGLIVELPPVDDRRKAARRRLAEAVDLPGFFPNIYRTGQAREDIIRAFELGGPIWLNANGRFEGAPSIISMMPLNVKQAMVADVRMDSERIAYDLSREIMKEVDEGHLDIAGQAYDSELARGGAPYTGKGDA